MSRASHIGPVIVILVWFVSSHLSLVDPALLASPEDTIRAVFQLGVSGYLGEHVFGTLSRLFTSFAIAVLIAVPAGLVLGFYRRVHLAFEGVIDFFRSIPVLALFPLFMVIFGIGDRAKIATAAWGCVPLVMISTIAGVRQCRTARILCAKSMGATKTQIFVKVVLPESLPSVFAGLRMGVSLALITIIITEMFLGTSRGLGKMIYDAGLVYQTPHLYGGILVVGTVGFLLNKSFLAAERRVTHWSGR